MFQESVRLSTGRRVQQCAPCSIIFRMKLIMPVFVHDDNVSGLHARKYCSVSVLQRQKYLFKISGADWRVCECHLLSQKPLGSSGGACVLLCFTLHMPKSSPCFFLVFLFSFFCKHKILLKANHFCGSVDSSSALFQRTYRRLSLLQFPFQPPTLIPQSTIFFFFLSR